MTQTLERSPAAQAAPKYDVGGVLLDRPFKIRRLGHFGLYITNMDEAHHFYLDLLGFLISDDLPMADRVRPEHGDILQRTRYTTGYFTRYGSDHHALVLFPKQLSEVLRPDTPPHITINQITWQVGSLAEVVNSLPYFEQVGVGIRRSGRDTPGSNWHTYPYDPDLHINELYYGIEQIGWDGYSKPKAMYNRGFQHAPSLPQISEAEEIQRALEAGVDLQSGSRYVDKNPRVFDVEGILLARPFKVVRIGPVRIFVQDVERARQFYEQALGLAVTAETTYQGHRCVFLRANTEHHSLALYPLALRETLGLSSHTTLLSFGLQVGSYRQLRDAASFLRERGVTLKMLPPELSPGIDYSFLAIDPDGHAMQLYYAVQQVGPDGTPWSGPLRLEGADDLHRWPATVEGRADTYLGEAFLGPWG